MADAIPEFADDLEEFVLALRKPVTFADATYTELKLREPTGAEWMQWDHLTGPASNFKAVSVICAMPEAAVRQIGTRDLLKAVRFLNRFF